MSDLWDPAARARARAEAAAMRLPAETPAPLVKSRAEWRARDQRQRSQGKRRYKVPEGSWKCSCRRRNLAEAAWCDWCGRDKAT